MPAENFDLNSSNLAGGSFDEETGQLMLTFKSGKTYPYANVPKAVVDGLRNAASPGSYFNSEIKGSYTE